MLDEYRHGVGAIKTYFIYFHERKDDWVVWVMDNRGQCNAAQHS